MIQQVFLYREREIKDDVNGLENCLAVDCLCVFIIIFWWLKFQFFFGESSIS